MALIVEDRVQETSTTAGTGTLTLLGAVSGFRTFSTAIGNGNTTYYAIINGTEWEVGQGTVGTGTLSRDIVLSSSTGSLVSFSSASKNVFVTYPADKSVYGNGTILVAPSGTILPVANGGTGVTTSTGSGNTVLSTSPTLVTPILGTPTSGTLTSCTGLLIGGITATGTPSATTYLRGDGTWSTVTAVGVSSVTGTAPISVSTTLGVANVSISQSTTSTNGYLSSTDWNTFNGKQPAGTYLTSATGVTTFSGNSTGLTPQTATSGAITLGGILVASNGGTGLAGTLTGISYMNGTGAYTVATAAQVVSTIGTTAVANATTAANGGVTSIVAGTGISISGATGAVTVTNTGIALPYSSGNQTISAAGLLTLGHGLGVVPSIVQFTAICITAEFNYAIGDIICINETVHDSLANSRGLTAVVNATNIVVRFDSANPPLTAMNKTTGVGVSLTAANWRLIVKAGK